MRRVNPCFEETGQIIFTMKVKQQPQVLFKAVHKCASLGHSSEYQSPCWFTSGSYCDDRL